MADPAVASSGTRTSLPIQAGHVVDRLVDDDLVLYDPKQQRVHVLNRTAALIWALCDGQHDQTAIAEALASRYGQSYQSVEPDVHEILALLGAAALLAE